MTVNPCLAQNIGGGLLVAPYEIEFWQGRLDRLHDRFVYRAKNGDWQIARLSP